MPDSLPDKPKADVATIRNWLALQRDEMEIRKDEVEVRKMEVENSAVYASASLRAQAEDLKDFRKHETEKFNNILIFFGITLLGLMFLAAIALYNGQQETVIEVIKIIGIFLGGGGAGYAIGHRRGHDQGRFDATPKNSED